ncbi:YrhK family protein [Marinobacter sp. AC-23]|uniref:YrhK family protein n=1 Tax=Marinobacter sp. AC-23 TaxID=1879031 RepID=UPI0011144E8A|nr:YrhK family protein [Marinobacter sp. AC-23]
MLFDPDLKSASQKHVRIYAIYEVLFTLVDFAAAFQFIVGSVLFFNESTTYEATWLFLVGSICFALKPTIKVIRECHLLRLGDIELLAKRARE